MNIFTIITFFLLIIGIGHLVLAIWFQERKISSLEQDNRNKQKNINKLYVRTDNLSRELTEVEKHLDIRVVGTSEKKVIYNEPD